MGFTDFTPETVIRADQLLTVGQAAKRLPKLTEGQLRGKIQDKQVRTIWIAGRCFLYEGDLEHAFGENFVKASK